MAVKKFDNGTWGYDERHPVTKRRKRVGGFDTRRQADEARSVLMEVWRSQRHGTTVDMRRVRLNLRGEIEKEIELLDAEAVDYFSQTKAKIAYTLRRYLPLIPAELKVMDFSPEHVEALIRHETRRRVKRSSITTYMTHLRTGLTRIKARNRDLLAGWTIPTAGVPKKFGATTGKLRRVWSPDEVERILSALDRPEEYLISGVRRRKTAKTVRHWREARDVLRIAAMTGMRKTEVLTVEIGKIYFEWGIMHVRTLKQRSAEPVYREIPLEGELESVIRERIAKVRARHGARERSLFPIFREDENANWLYRSLRQAAEFAGVQYGQGEFGIVPHGLRHTAATRMLANGADLKTAADILGDTVETMMRSYAHTNIESKRRALRGLELTAIKSNPISSKKRAA
jgi:integrase